MRITKNKIVVTGATHGIGEALTARLLRENNTVIAVGRDSDKLAKLSAGSDRIVPFRADLSARDEVENLARFVAAEHADTNWLINNAGIQRNYSFADLSDHHSQIEDEIAVNLLAPLRLSALLLPVIGRNPNSAIINVTSALAIVPKQDAAVYCASKAGVHLFSLALRLQLPGTKVFEVIPPLVDTRMTQGRSSGKMSPAELSQIIVHSIRNDTLEIRAGKAKLLLLANRISPAFARRLLQTR